jgi:iron(III) transport system ATP-binding protein
VTFAHADEEAEPEAGGNSTVEEQKEHKALSARALARPPLREGDNVVLRILTLEKHFQREKGEQVRAIDNVSLDIERGAMVTVLGPSGCGKTTLLRCIAGLEIPSGGEIWNEGRLLSSGARGIIIPPERRQFGMMFQSYAVWPHMSVFRNVAYPLRGRDWPRSRVTERVENILEIVGIKHLRNEYPGRMSGGQQQRVALARSLVNEPKVILFDEPLSNVDAKVREDLRLELLSMQQKIGFAGVYVTHDQDEAMAISDRIVVMNEGKVLQLGTPREIYRQPASRFVANFIGAANMWEGNVTSRSGSGATVVACEIGDAVVTSGLASTGGEGVVVVARPEALTVSSQAPRGGGHANIWSGTLRTEMFCGDHTEYFVEIRGRLVRGRSSQDQPAGRTPLAVGDAVFVSAHPNELTILPRVDSVPSEALSVDPSVAPREKTSDQ